MVDILKLAIAWTVLFLPLYGFAFAVGWVLSVFKTFADSD